MTIRSSLSLFFLCHRTCTLLMYFILCVNVLSSNRNSTQLVEAAFDGDLGEVKNYLDKGDLTGVFEMLYCLVKVVGISAIISITLRPLLLFVELLCFLRLSFGIRGWPQAYSPFRSSLPRAYGSYHALAPGKEKTVDFKFPRLCVHWTKLPRVNYFSVV